MSELVVTHEIAPLPQRSPEAHKGHLGRIVVIGGCNAEVLMVGAPALVANAALRAGAGLVQMLVPAELRQPACVLAPCATARSLPDSAKEILQCVEDYSADVLAIGPGLSNSLKAETLIEVLDRFGGSCVVDADALNGLAHFGDDQELSASSVRWSIRNPQRMVLTPHPGEARKLLEFFGIQKSIDATTHSRRAAACALVEATGCNIVLKGHGTVVTNGERIYTNETGNAGMATAGTGDVLTGIIAGLIGQHMPPYEASILGVYLHGLAGDFAAEELGRHSMTALDVLDYLPDAFLEHESTFSN